MEYRNMKLCAIYNVWNDYTMLVHSVTNILNLVDVIIIVYSDISNYGEVHAMNMAMFRECKLIKHDPIIGLTPYENEKDKRNIGLELAKDLNCTHFLTIDADEFYNPEQFLRERERFKTEQGLNGLVCASQVYFKSPELTIGLDVTLVPFIHKLTPEIEHRMNQKYPYAFDGRQIKIDPTRQLNIDSGVKWSDIIMDHYSWVREDIEVKIRNSTARNNIERSTIRQDYKLAKEGYFCKFYNKTLVRVLNKYNLPDYGVEI